MKTFETPSKTIKVFTDVSDMSVEKFQQLIEINSKKYEFKVEQDIAVIMCLSNLSEEEIDELEIEFFNEIITTALKITSGIENQYEFIYELEVDDIKYKSSKNSNFSFKVKERKIIEKLIRKNPDSYINDLLGIIFKELDSDGNLIEDYSSEAIEKRKNALKSKVSITIMLPYIQLITELLSKSVKLD